MSGKKSSVQTIIVSIEPSAIFVCIYSGDSVQDDHVTKLLEMCLEHENE